FRPGISERPRFWGRRFNWESEWDIAELCHNRGAEILLICERHWGHQLSERGGGRDSLAGESGISISFPLVWDVWRICRLVPGTPTLGRAHEEPGHGGQYGVERNGFLYTDRRAEHVERGFSERALLSTRRGLGSVGDSGAGRRAGDRS